MTVFKAFFFFLKSSLLQLKSIGGNHVEDKTTTKLFTELMVFVCLFVCFQVIITWNYRRDRIWF